MGARVLDGQALATRMQQQEIQPQVAEFARRHGRPPALAIVLVGSNPASEIYVRNKLKAGSDIGFRTDLERMPADTTLADVLGLVDRLNRSPVHDGILVQSPLPKALGAAAAQRVFDAIAPEKDVDGFNPTNVGLMVQNRPALIACTPSGIIELLERERIPIRGSHAVVIGRSDIVGKPMALLLMHRDATVTICHSKTPDLAGVCRQADILIAATGRAGLVTKAFVKPGAAVIDVGMNTVTDSAIAQHLFPDGHPRLARFRERGSILVGDVHPEVAAVAGALTPVPGGVGPLTITMLMMNTLRAAQAIVSRQSAVGRRQRPVRRIALTGGIATGKSYVRSRFEALGVPTIDSDVLARAAVAPGSEGLKAVVTRFGPGVLDAQGALDRARLARIVFGDRAARRDLEAIIHPDVRHATERWFASLDAACHPLAIADIPLLYEVGREGDFDAVIVAATDPETQLRRVMKRNNLSEEEARQRIAAQLPIDTKVRRADYVIRTEGTFEETDRQVREVFERLSAS